MAQINADRVRESTATTGTGAIALGGAAVGFRAFSSVCAVADTAFYCIVATDGSWEVGNGTYSAASTLTRTTVLASSNANAAVSFAAGTKDVFLTAPATFLADKARVGLGNVDNTTDVGKPVSTAQAAADALKANAASPAFTGTPTGLQKSHVGLGNVDNTADTAKPVSTAQQTALDAKLNLVGGRLASLSVTGNITCDSIVSGLTGFQARAGSGGSPSNIFNINWSNNAAQLWIDSSNVGTLSLTSDERIKQNILPLANVTQAFMGIVPITYKFRDIGVWDADGKTYWGFSAQNLSSALPSSVVGDVSAVNPDGTPIPASVMDRPILAVTVHVLQALVSEVEVLRSRVVALEARPFL